MLFFVVRYPNKYEAIILEYSHEFNVEPSLIKGVIWTESKYKKNAISASGACGLMQIMPQTAIWCAQVLGQKYSQEEIFEEKMNIKLGVFYLSYLLAKFDEHNALAAYNAGENKVLFWQSQGCVEPLFKETREYVRRVERAKKIYYWRDKMPF